MTGGRHDPSFRLFICLCICTLLVCLFLCHPFVSVRDVRVETMGGPI